MWQLTTRARWQAVTDSTVDGELFSTGPGQSRSSLVVDSTVNGELLSKRAGNPQILPVADPTVNGELSSAVPASPRCPQVADSTVNGELLSKRLAREATQVVADSTVNGELLSRCLHNRLISISFYSSSHKNSESTVFSSSASQKILLGNRLRDNPAKTEVASLDHWCNYHALADVIGIFRRLAVSVFRERFP